MGNLFSNPGTSEQLITEEDQWWMRLSLGVKKHGNQALVNFLKQKCRISCPKKLHSWIAAAEAKARKANKDKRDEDTKQDLFKVPNFVLRKLLGNCHKECHENSSSCNEETNIDKLDITSLSNIFKNIEYIIPEDILSNTRIVELKKKHKHCVSIIANERNSLAHYPKISDNVFNKKWKAILGALNNLDYSNEERKHFESLKTSSLDPYLKNQVELIKDALKEMKQAKEERFQEQDQRIEQLEKLLETFEKQYKNKILYLHFNIEGIELTTNDIDLDGDLSTKLNNTFQNIIAKKCCVIESETFVNLTWVINHLPPTPTPTPTALVCNISSGDHDFKEFENQRSTESKEIRNKLKKAASEALQEFCNGEIPKLSISAFRVQCLFVVFEFTCNNKPWEKSKNILFQDILRRKVQSLFTETMTINFSNQNLRSIGTFIVRLEVTTLSNVEDFIECFEGFDAIPLENKCTRLKNVFIRIKESKEDELWMPIDYAIKRKSIFDIPDVEFNEAIRTQLSIPTKNEILKACVGLEEWIKLQFFIHDTMKYSLLNILCNLHDDPDFEGFPTVPEKVYKALTEKYGTLIREMVRDEEINNHDYKLLFPENKKTLLGKLPIGLIIKLLEKCTPYSKQASNKSLQRAVRDAVDLIQMFKSLPADKITGKILITFLRKAKPILVNLKSSDTVKELEDMHSKCITYVNNEATLLWIHALQYFNNELLKDSDGDEVNLSILNWYNRLQGAGPSLDIEEYNVIMKEARELLQNKYKLKQKDLDLKKRSNEVVLADLMSDKEKLKKITKVLDYPFSEESWNKILEELYTQGIVAEKNYAKYDRNKYGGGSSAKAFLIKLKFEQPETEIDDFIEKAEKHKRGDVKNDLISFRSTGKVTLMNDLTNSQIEKLADKLDLKGTYSDWKLFASSYGYDRKIINELKAQKEKTDEWSPTESVLQYLLQECPRYPLSKFANVLNKIRRNDAKLVIKEIIAGDNPQPRKIFYEWNY